MIKIPFTKSVILTARERNVFAGYFEASSLALSASGRLNISLHSEWAIATAKCRELATMLVDQAEVTKQIMQINLLITTALGQIRAADFGPEVNEIIQGLEASLQEFELSP